MMLLVHKDISHMPITELENNSESVWVKVFANKASHYVASRYLVVLLKTFICSEINLTISGTNTKVKNSPRFMFQGISTLEILIGQTDLTNQVQR